MLDKLLKPGMHRIAFVSAALGGIQLCTNREDLQQQRVRTCIREIGSIRNPSDPIKIPDITYLT